MAATRRTPVDGWRVRAGSPCPSGHVVEPIALIDSDIPTYVMDSPHQNKVAAQQRLEQLVTGGEALVSDAPVMRVLHRYQAIDHLDAAQPALHVVQVRRP